MTVRVEAEPFDFAAEAAAFAAEELVSVRAA
jgi:hypothetical protein